MFIASIYPYQIVEHKPGLDPSTYTIEGTDNEDEPTFLEVHDVHYYVFVNRDVGSHKVGVPADVLAKSLVNDFRVGCLGVTPTAYPGIFVLENPEGQELDNSLTKAQQAQHDWFKVLVHMADNDWSKYQRPGAINRLQRHAAKALGLDREWSMDISATPTFCPACTKVVDARAVVCMHCNCVLNPEVYKTLTFANVHPQLIENKPASSVEA